MALSTVKLLVSILSCMILARYEKDNREWEYFAVTFCSSPSSLLTCYYCLAQGGIPIAGIISLCCHGHLAAIFSCFFDNKQIKENEKKLCFSIRLFHVKLLCPKLRCFQRHQWIEYFFTELTGISGTNILESKREKQVPGESECVRSLFKYSLSWTNTPVGYSLSQAFWIQNLS